MENAEPAYWAVIPANVRYSAELPAGAKLLYAEISSLVKERGYCYAGNSYFEKLYRISEATVQRYLRALKKLGFVQIEDGDGGAGRRKIYAGLNPLSQNPVKNDGVGANPRKNDGGTPAKMTPDPRKNDTQNSKENSKDYNPPTPQRKKSEALPPELMNRAMHYAGGDGKLLRALLDFAEQRKAQRKPITTHRMLTLLLNRLDELSGGDDATKIAMLDAATLRGWQTVYALRDDERPRGSPPPAQRTVEAPEEVARW